MTVSIMLYFTRLLSICDHTFRYDCSGSMVWAYIILSNFAHFVRFKSVYLDYPRI